MSMNLFIFIDSGFFSVGEGADVLSRIFNWILFVAEPYQIKMIIPSSVR